MSIEIKEDVYNSLVRTIELIGVELKEVSIERNRMKNHVKMDIDFEASIDKWYLEDDIYSVEVSFGVNAKDHETDVFDLKFTFIIDYHLNSDLDWEDDYYDLFAHKNTPTNVWPFAREFISSTTVRMGYPSLTLPLHKNPLEPNSND
ncbi:protein-export chaperone SecB [Shouchella miscanthi]|uniref:Protein-export chaperone SecB n=1 Tax=Shouchella miscanthi TaxID=2598861 RepID=A0ABU6NN89_9BACI|nr:protein-export chaperone SecB [Shouchella miscanthi]MED4129004.1 protein-export chaperone SecB [Shouchella miscanthi]